MKKIVTHLAEVLETPAEEVTVFDKKLKKLLDDMYDTMLEMDGVGLAAPQIGILKERPSWTSVKKAAGSTL